MTKKKHSDQPPQVPVNENAPHPETSTPPEADEDTDEERHNAPHADDYDRLAEVRNDKKD